jgi:predicted nuclease of predicted toxin-antitoxin system
VNLVCDENIHRLLVAALRAAGHDVVYIAELSPSVVDREVLRQANERGAVLITDDKDFGELVFRLGMLSAGVLLLRLHNAAHDERQRIVLSTISEHGAELPGHFAVLSTTKLRIRKQS